MSDCVCMEGMGEMWGICIFGNMCMYLNIYVYVYLEVLACLCVCERAYTCIHARVKGMLARVWRVWEGDWEYVYLGICVCL